MAVGLKELNFGVYPNKTTISLEDEDIKSIKKGCYSQVFIQSQNTVLFRHGASDIFKEVEKDGATALAINNYNIFVTISLLYSFLQFHL